MTSEEDITPTTLTEMYEEYAHGYSEMDKEKVEKDDNKDARENMNIKHRRPKWMK